jgi:hypothetical protein
MSRLTKYTEEIQNEICSYILDWYSFNQSCELIGIDRSTGWRWKRKFPDFAIAIKNAMNKRLNEWKKRGIENIKNELKKRELEDSFIPGRRGYSFRIYKPKIRDAKGRFIK